MTMAPESVVFQRRDVRDLRRVATDVAVIVLVALPLWASNGATVLRRFDVKVARRVAVGGGKEATPPGPRRSAGSRRC